MPSDTSDTLRAPKERVLGMEELFFSTTDARGRIRQGNSVFARISGYTLEELLGEPHNLVRHPGMPSGVFRLMWERLSAGLTVGMYVCNQTSSGDHYWVWAVVSPLHDGFVSVRMSPRSAEFDVACDVYREVLAVEHRATRSGGMRRDVAEVGQIALEQNFKRRGYPSYEAFMHHAMPREIADRASFASTLHQRSDATGEAAVVMAGTRAVEGWLSELVSRLVGFDALGARLAETSGHVLEMTGRLEGSVDAAQDASKLVALSTPVLANVARVMAQPMNAAVEQLEQLPAAFALLRRDIARVQFQIGVAALYNTMAAAFAAEVSDGLAPEESLSAIPLLTDAAETCVVDMAGQVEQINADLRELAEHVSGAVSLLDDFRRFIGQWRHLVLRHAHGTLGPQARPIDEEITASWAWTEQLQNLGREASQAIVPFDPTLLRRHLDSMRARPESA